MTLRRCPSCKNQVAAESETCPVCGCEPVMYRVRRALTWTVVILAVGWAAEHYIGRDWHSHPHHKAGAQSNAGFAVVEDH